MGGHGGVALELGNEGDALVELLSFGGKHESSGRIEEEMRVRQGLLDEQRVEVSHREKNGVVSESEPIGCLFEELDDLEPLVVGVGFQGFGLESNVEDANGIEEGVVLHLEGLVNSRGGLSWVVNYVVREDTALLTKGLLLVANLVEVGAPENLGVLPSVQS